VLVLFANGNEINCCQSRSYHIAFALNNEGVLWDPPGTHPGSLHVTTLHGSLILWRGLTLPDPPLFRTLFDARSPGYSTLVRCSRTRHIQAMHDRLQVSARFDWLSMV